MDLPSTRELELEALLRQRDAQLADVTDEVSRLRTHLSTQPGLSTTDPVSLPPPLASILLPHLRNAIADQSDTSGAAGSSTTIAALIQRARLLQDENDELYEVLNRGETGKLKDEVRSLRRVVTKLEGALRESHKVIQSLSDELDKSYDSFMTTARQNGSVKSHSPRNSYAQPAPSGNGPGVTSSSKALPTGPRAHKKARLSESPTISSSRSHHRSRGGGGGGGDHPERMDENEDDRPRPRKEGSRERPRQKEKERDRGRDRDGNRSRGSNGTSGGASGRSAGGGGGGGGGSRRGQSQSTSNGAGAGSSSSTDRTLAERMGL